MGPRSWRRVRSLSTGVLALLIVVACAQAGPALPPEPNGRNGRLDVAVLVGANARRPSDLEVSRVVTRARQKLLEKSGVELRLTEIADGLPNEIDPSRSAAAYLATVAANPPEVAAVLSADPTARLYGGWAFVIHQPAPFTNEFPSPRADYGSRVVYGAALDFDHVFARCGYDGQGRHTSDTNGPGECWSPPGIVPCVERPHGWVCANSLADPYADPDYFHACNLLHEVLHSFGHAGNYDHFGASRPAGHTGAPTCTDRMPGLSLSNSQDNCAMCPDLWAAVRRAPPLD